VKKQRERADVIVFGEAIWDFFPRTAGEALATRRHEVRHPGGAPANVARTLARLGVTTSIVTAVGRDALGDGLLMELREAGVRTDDVVRLTSRTAVTFVDVTKKGERSFLFYRHPSADMQFEEAMLPLHAFSAAWLHVGSSTLAREPSRTATRTIVARAAASGARLSVDLNVRRHLWSTPGELAGATQRLIDRADVLKVSEDDLIALDLPADVEGARRLHARRHERVTFLTLAARGAIGFWGDEEVRVRAPRAKVVDVTGAGDAFTAGALATFVRTDALTPELVAIDGHRRRVLERALTVGCTLGTRAVTRLGATSALRTLSPMARQVKAPLAARPVERHR
jgi:fructokinase